MNSYVYIMASNSGVIYTGVTNDLARRVYEHKNHFSPSSFTSRYNCHKLVYCERYDDIEQAFVRETTIKKWRRTKKTALIATNNPEWDDLAIEFAEAEERNA